MFDWFSLPILFLSGCVGTCPCDGIEKRVQWISFKEAGFCLFFSKHIFNFLSKVFLKYIFKIICVMSFVTIAECQELCLSFDFQMKHRNYEQVEKVNTAACHSIYDKSIGKVQTVFNLTKLFSRFSSGA